MDHKCSMCFVCVCVPCLSICFSLSNLKPFWFGARGDCSQMLIRGRLQTAISLISLGEATWGSVRAKAEQRKHVWSYQPVAHSEKREAFSLFHLWKEEFKAECPPPPLHPPALYNGEVRLFIKTRGLVSVSSTPLIYPDLFLKGDQCLSPVTFSKAEQQ